MCNPVDADNPLASLHDPSLFIREAFVGGSWVSSQSSFDVSEPANRRVISQVTDLSREEVIEAIKYASIAQKVFYRSTTAARRGDLLYSWHRLVLDNFRHLAIILCLENGKTFSEAGAGIEYSANFLRWFAEEAPRAIVAREETFGPLAPIFDLDTEEEAVELANKTESGLASYVFSDVGRVMRVSQNLESGMVGCNVGIISAAESPFGGVEESGYGKEGSTYGLQEYQVLKSVTIGNTHH